MWPQVELRQLAASFGRKRQQALYLVAQFAEAHDQVHLTQGRCQGNWLESAPEGSVGHRWRNPGPTHSVLEHAHTAAAALGRHGQPGLQPDVQQELTRDCVNAWLLIELDHLVEVPHHEEDPNTDRAQPARALPGHEPVRREYRDGRW